MVVSTGEALLPAARERRGMLPPWALIAAAALHLLPVLIALWHWPMASQPAAAVFKVTLVRAPPKPAVAAPPPATTVPKPRESGPDQTTEAKQTAKPEPAAPPRARAEPAPESHHAVAVTPKPAIEGMRVLELHLPPRGAGNRNQAGDPYLNALMERIESNRIYPPASAFYGAVQRVVVFSVGVDPSGSVSTITLLAPSGQSLIDEAGRQMIAASAPFPRLPADLPPVRTSIIIYIPVFPRGD